MTNVIVPRHQQCCGNCAAGFPEGNLVRCRFNPPQVVVIRKFDAERVKQLENIDRMETRDVVHALVEIAKHDAQQQFEIVAAFPPMHPNGHCEQWARKEIDA